MSDDFEVLRRMKPDTVQPSDPEDPTLFTRAKSRLMSMIGNEEATPDESSTPAIYPRLAYVDEVAALDFLTRVFGFRERREARMGTGAPDDGMLAWLEFGTGVVMIGRADEPVHRVHRIYSPQEVGRSTAMMNVTVHDIDSHYANAVAEGADVTMELEDAFYGDRRYEVTDPEGHRWHFSESFAAIRARGGRPPQTD